MGLAASQARLLNLTARMHDIEYKAQNLEAQKLQMANESNHVYQVYEDALNKQKVQMKQLAADGSITFVDATYNTLVAAGYQIEFIDPIYNPYQTITSSFIDSYKGTPSDVSYLQDINDVNTFTAGDSYVINDVAGLQKLANMVNGTNGYTACDMSNVSFTLGGDIDLSGINWTPIGSDSTNPFKGTLNGNGYTISNLTIANSTNGYQGFFGCIDGGAIVNLDLKNVSINGGTDFTGALAGGVSNATIYNCNASGSVSGNKFVGGLIGALDYGSITKSSTNVDVKSTTQKAAGGIVGDLGRTGSITSSFSTGNVSAINYAGGIVGTNSSTMIKYCYSTGNIVATAPISSAAGGIVGYDSVQTATNCYYSGTITGHQQNSTGVQSTPAQIQAENNLPHAIDVTHKVLSLSEENKNSTEWLENMLTGGYIILHKPIYNTDGTTTYTEVNVATDTNLQEVSDPVELKKAEAKYEADMRRINAKDKKFDTDIAALETERNAIKTEVETLKTVAKENVDRTFKLFS